MPCLVYAAQGHTVTTWTIAHTEVGGARGTTRSEVVSEIHKTMLRDGAVTTEPQDLLPGAGDYRLTDVAPSTYRGGKKPKALDIFVGR